MTNLMGILFKKRCDHTLLYPELCNTYFSLQESSTNSSMIAGLASANEVQCIYCAVNLLILECILFYIFTVYTSFSDNKYTCTVYAVSVTYNNIPGSQLELSFYFFHLHVWSMLIVGEALHSNSIAAYVRPLRKYCAVSNFKLY